VSEPLVHVGAERVEAVDVVTVDEAYERFKSIDRHDLAELYKVAAVLGAEKLPRLLGLDDSLPD
jgi:hypothetical protein